MKLGHRLAAAWVQDLSIVSNGAELSPQPVRMFGLSWT